MNEELQKALADVINKASSGIDTASDFIMAELPEVVQQAMTWYMVESLIYFVIGVLMMLFSYAVIKFQASLAMNDDGELAAWTDDGYGLSVQFVFYCIFVVILDVSMIITSVNCILNLDWLKIWIAPKLWLIEYAAKLAG